MADVTSVTSLKSTIFAPSTMGAQGHAIHLQKQVPISISASSFCRNKPQRLQCGQTALKSKLGDSSTLCRRGLAGNPRIRSQEAQGEAAISIASASRDAGSSNGGEDNIDDNRSGWSPRDGFGLYPWDPSWQAMDLDDLQWIQEESITLFTSEGIVKLGGSRMVSPRTSYMERKYAHLRALSKLKRYREEDYMDPKQGLCLGAIFDIAATNGLDMGRRFCVFGFCRSIEMLSDVVEDTVLGQGGEVVIAEKWSSTGLHEKLSMTVAMPALWGVPPAFDVLNNAIRSGGGIVEKTYKKWEFL